MFFFCFFKFIFDINTLKRYENTKKINFKQQENFQILGKQIGCTAKHPSKDNPMRSKGFLFPFSIKFLIDICCQ
jgi:hypothetical protein